MKSLRTNLTLSMISVNILVILLLSLSIIAGFFRIDSDWYSGVLTDITALLNVTLTKEYPDLQNLEELDSEDFKTLVEKVLEDYKGRLRSIILYSPSGTVLYAYNITDIYDNHSKSKNRPELLRWVTNIKIKIFRFKPEHSGILIGKNTAAVGKVEIFTSPLMGYKYTVLFDRTITTSFFTGIITASFVSLAISFYFSRKLSRQSKIFATQLSELAGGRRSINFTNGSTTEMQSTVNAAQCLQEELKINEKVQQQRLQDILHDLKTPVSALGIQFEAVRDEVLQMDAERLDLFLSEFVKIEEMITELSQYTHLTSEEYIPQHEIVNINNTIDELSERFLAQAVRKKQILKIKKLEKNYSIHCDKIGLQRVLNNITTNALNNAPESSTIKISAYWRKRITDETNQLSIEVENEGRLNTEDLPLIFNRLYRSKNSGYHGSGLGLAISKAIVEKNGGKITALNTAFNTVIFRIELPVTARTT